MTARPTGTEPPSFPRPRGNPRYATLDAWRGIACLMIVVLHASFYENHDPAAAARRLESPVGGAVMAGIARLGVGVPMFFVISGYCIAATADSSRRRGRAVGQYFRRRFRRIFPPYWAALLLATLLTVLAAAAGHRTLLSDADSSIPHPSEVSTIQWLGNLTLTEHWRHHLFGDGELKVLGPSWTLCYEEQFYLVCGLILLAAPRRFFMGAVVVTAAVLCAWPLSFTPAGASVRGFFFDGRWFMFAFGILVFYQLNYASRRRALALGATLAACVAGCVVLKEVVLRDAGTWEQKDHLFELGFAAGFALLLSLLRPWDAQVAAWKPLRPLAFCGVMCYSLYLTHWPVCKLISHVFYDHGVQGVWPTLALTIPVATAASVLVAWGFHVAVERFFMNPPRPAPPAEGPAAAAAQARVPVAGRSGIADSRTAAMM